MLRSANLSSCKVPDRWAMEQFGTECFEYTAKFDFDRQPELKQAFSVSKEPARIIKELTLY